LGNLISAVYKFLSVYKSIDGFETSWPKPQFDSDERIFLELTRRVQFASFVLDQELKISGYDHLPTMGYPAYFCQAFFETTGL